MGAFPVNRRLQSVVRELTIYDDDVVENDRKQ